METKAAGPSDDQSEDKARTTIEPEPATVPSDRATRLIRFTYVLILTVVVAGAFLRLIGDFLIDIVLAIIFAGLLHPLLEKSLPRFRGRRDIAAAAIVVAAILVVALPLAGIVAIV